MSVTLAPIPMELVRLSDELQSLGGGDALVSKMRVVARLVGPSPPAPCALQLDAGNADTVVISSGSAGLAAAQRYPMSVAFPPKAPNSDLIFALASHASQTVISGYHCNILALGALGLGKSTLLFGNADVNGRQSDSSCIVRHCASALLDHIHQSDIEFEEMPLSEGKVRMLQQRQKQGGVRWLLGVGYQELGLEGVLDMFKSAKDGKPVANSAPAEYASIEYLTSADSTLITISDLAQLDRCLALARTKSPNWTRDQAAVDGRPLPNFHHALVRLVLMDLEHSRVSVLNIIDPIGAASLSTKFVPHALRMYGSTTFDSSSESFEADQHRMRSQLASLHRFLMELSIHCQPEQPSTAHPPGVRKGIPTTSYSSPALSTASSAGAQQSGKSLSIRESPLTLWLGPLLARDHQTVLLAMLSTATADAADMLPLLRLTARCATVHIPCVRAGAGGGLGRPSKIAIDWITKSLLPHTRVASVWLDEWHQKQRAGQVSKAVALTSTSEKSKRALVHEAQSERSAPLPLKSAMSATKPAMIRYDSSSESEDAESVPISESAPAHAPSYQRSIEKENRLDETMNLSELKPRPQSAPSTVKKATKTASKSAIRPSTAKATTPAPPERKPSVPRLSASASAKSISSAAKSKPLARSSSTTLTPQKGTTPAAQVAAALAVHLRQQQKSAAPANTSKAQPPRRPPNDIHPLRVSASAPSLAPRDSIQRDMLHDDVDPLDDEDAHHGNAVPPSAIQRLKNEMEARGLLAAADRDRLVAQERDSGKQDRRSVTPERSISPPTRGARVTRSPGSPSIQPRSSVPIRYASRVMSPSEQFHVRQTLQGDGVTEATRKKAGRDSEEADSTLFGLTSSTSLVAATRALDKMHTATKTSSELVDAEANKALRKTRFGDELQSRPPVERSASASAAKNSTLMTHDKVDLSLADYLTRSPQLNAGEVTQLQSCCAQMLGMLRQRLGAAEEGGVDVLDELQSRVQLELSVADLKYQNIQLQAEVRRYRSESSSAEVIEFYEQQLHSTQRECASLRERHLDAEQRLLKALDSQRLRAIDGQQQLLRHSLSTASGLSMSSSAASLHSDVDRDVTAAGISKAASEAYSKQTAIMQRNLKDLQEKLSKCQTENEQWLKKEREFKYRTSLLEESFRKNESMHKALTQKTRELAEAKSARDVAVAEVSSMKGRFEDSNHRVVQMEKELNAALEELETNRQYIRQLSQESREKEILYKVRNIKVSIPERLHKPLPAFVALEKALAKPQYVPSVRCTKLINELGEQIKDLDKQRVDAIEKEKQVIRALSDEMRRLQRE